MSWGGRGPRPPTGNDRKREMYAAMKGQGQEMPAPVPAAGPAPMPGIGAVTSPVMASPVTTRPVFQAWPMAGQAPRHQPDIAQLVAAMMGRTYG